MTRSGPLSWLPSKPNDSIFMPLEMVWHIPDYNKCLYIHVMVGNSKELQLLKSVASHPEKEDNYNPWSTSYRQDLFKLEENDQDEITCVTYATTQKKLCIGSKLGKTYTDTL